MNLLKMRLNKNFAVVLAMLLASLSACSEPQPTELFSDRDLYPQYLQFQTCWWDQGVDNPYGILLIDLTGPEVNFTGKRILVRDQFLWEGAHNAEYSLTVRELPTAGGDTLYVDTLVALAYLGYDDCREGDCIEVHRIECE